VFDVVAGSVFAVLGELDGEPMVRTTVLSRQIAFNDESGLQLQAANLG
jgi:hypothetical protein